MLAAWRVWLTGRQAGKLYPRLMVQPDFFARLNKYPELRRPDSSRQTPIVKWTDEPICFFYILLWCLIRVNCPLLLSQHG